MNSNLEHAHFGSAVTDRPTVSKTETKKNPCSGLIVLMNSSSITVSEHVQKELLLRLLSPHPPISPRGFDSSLRNKTNIE